MNFITTILWREDPSGGQKRDVDNDKDLELPRRPRTRQKEGDQVPPPVGRIHVITQCEGTAARRCYMRKIYQIDHAVGHLIQCRNSHHSKYPTLIPLS